MDTMNLKKGDHVVYGNNGICQVDDIAEMAFPTGGDKKLYIMLKPQKDPASVIYLPHDNTVLTSRLRPLLSRREAETLLAQDALPATSWIEDRKERTTMFRETLQANDPKSLMPLVKCLCLHRDSLGTQKKKMSGADRELLTLALGALCGELSFVLETSHDEILEKLRDRLGVAL